MMSPNKISEAILFGANLNHTLTFSPSIPRICMCLMRIEKKKDLKK